MWEHIAFWAELIIGAAVSLFVLGCAFLGLIVFSGIVPMTGG